MFLHLRMNLAYKKILGKFTKKVLGFGKTPPHVGKNSQIISFFFLWERTLVLLFNQLYYVWNPVLSKNVCFIWILNLRGKFGAKSSLTAMNTNVGLIWRNVEVWRRWASGWLTNISKDDTFWNVYWMNVF